jgi:SsrA-binding protein
MQRKQEKIISNNKSVYHNYFVEDVIEAGIVLTGTEIKSIRLGKVSINDAYCDFKNKEMLIVNMHISLYDKGNIFNHNPLRERKLLLHKKEIIKLEYLQSKSGYTIIPLKVLIKNGLCKIEIGLCKGKKLYDKREAEKTKTIEREIREKY